MDAAWASRLLIPAVPNRTKSSRRLCCIGGSARSQHFKQRRIAVASPIVPLNGSWRSPPTGEGAPPSRLPALSFDADLQSPSLALLAAIGRTIAAQAERNVAQGIALLSGLAGGSKRPYSQSVAEVTTVEEALMRVPDLETIPFRVLRRRQGYEIRQVQVSVAIGAPGSPAPAPSTCTQRGDLGTEVESSHKLWAMAVVARDWWAQAYTVAQVPMNSSSGFDFFGSSSAFSVLADYLFGKNTGRQSMEMTTPVVSTSQKQGGGTAMEMTTPVISSRQGGAATGTALEMTTPVISAQAPSSSWTMAFLLPAEFIPEELPQPLDPSVVLRSVPARTMAVVAFSGLVTDADVAAREAKLRAKLEEDAEFCVAPSSQLTVLQYNPPFDLPPFRRNEVAIEVVRRDSESLSVQK